MYARLALVAATAVGAIAWALYATTYPEGIDAHAYYIAGPGHLYGGLLGRSDTYLYSPAFSQLVEPLRWLGWDGFRTGIRLLDGAALTVLAGPLVGLLLAVNPVTLDFNLANINMLLGLAVVAGLRWPGLWSFVLLTKVTPGIGLLWYAARREWRSLGIALGVTAGIAAVSFAAGPGDWVAWLGSLAGNTQHQAVADQLIAAPLALRLPAAAALVWWGAKADRRWTVLAAAFLALPVIYQESITMLAGLLALRWGPFLLGRPAAPATQAPAAARDSLLARKYRADCGKPPCAFRGGMHHQPSSDGTHRRHHTWHASAPPAALTGGARP